MPSVGSFKAQPVTKTFAVTQGGGSTGVYIFTNQNINTWYNENSSDVTKVSDSFYIVTGNFYDVVGNRDLNGLQDSGEYDGRKSLIDFGKEVIIGNTVNSRLLVLRRVQVWDSASVGGDGREFYVVSENHTTDLAPNDWGRLTVRVARI